MKGLTADVYRAADGMDCTARGVTRRVKEVTIVGIDGHAAKIPEIFEATPERPAFIIKIKYVGMKGKPYVYAVPKVLHDKNAWTMMGGNFIYSCDSRFRDLVCEYPVPVHDRVEHSCGHAIANWQEDGTCAVCEANREMKSLVAGILHV